MEVPQQGKKRVNTQMECIIERQCASRETPLFFLRDALIFAVRVSKQTCWDEPGLREAHLEVLDAALAHELNV